MGRESLMSTVINPEVDRKKVQSRVISQRYKAYATGYLMTAPFFILFCIFIIMPVIWSLVLSFTHYNIVQPMKFAGLRNYIELFTNDELFALSFKNTITFSIIAGPIGFMASFFFAWVINQLKFRNGFSLAFYAPSIVSGIAMSTVWLALFSPDRLGHVNNFLINMGIVNDPILWTMDPQYIMPLVIAISVWMSLGTGFLTNIAGLNTIPPSCYEAAAIDGVKNKFQELFYITLPQMKPYLLFNAIMSTVGALNVGGMVSAIAGNPSPDYCAHTIALHLEDMAFVRFELGYASAISFILFLLNFTIGRIFMKLLASDDE